MSLPGYIVIPRFIPEGGPIEPERCGANDDEVAEIRRLYAAGRTQKWIWAHFDLRFSVSHIHQIVHKRGRFDDAK